MSYLILKMEGKALTVHNTLKVDKTLDYTCFNRAVLHKFQITPKTF